jgi:hypothetical protein
MLLRVKACGWILLSVFCVGAFAQVPTRFHYQGYLATSGGVPVSATLEMRFSLWDQPSGGNEAWAETRTVPVSNGHFSVLLGAAVPLALSFDKPYYLELQVGTDAPMTPRQALASAPYAAAVALPACEPGDIVGCYTGPAGSLGVGICRAGSRTCGDQRRYGPCVGEVLPATEVFDGLDNDCDGATDEATLALGASCSGSSFCASGNCVDNVCCNSTCTGSCRACDVSGSEGTCVNVPAGSDPDNECPGIACNAFYFGWVGDTCYRRADAPAATVACNGAGACQSASQVCPLRPQGAVQITCHPTCQDPNPATCTGTTAGSCVNVNPGTQTCGVGACMNTVPQCVNGAPVACVPLC